jgi:NADH-quinone oxidoreductase subunit K
MTLPPISIHHYLALSALLFCLGLVGVVVRKNLLIMFMCIEVMMNSVNLSFVALARYYGRMDGHVIAIFVMAIAAVEAAIGLGIVIALFRNRQSVNTADFTMMRG